MISVVIPTRNRGYVLRRTLPAYYQQHGVNQVVIVDDGGSDATEQVIAEIAKMYPEVETKYIKHSVQKGAAAARNTGVKNACGQYVLFGDDDALPELTYTRLLYKKLMANSQLAGASGRWIQMLPGETEEEAKIRFGHGFENKKPFNQYSLLLNTEAKFSEDVFLPLIPPVLLAEKKIVQKYPFNEKFNRGNGYREESTFQIQAFNDGYEFLLTNDTACLHLPKETIRHGGQRTSSQFRYFFWCMYFNRIFLTKYFSGYKKRLGMKSPKILSEIVFGCVQFYISVIKPLGSIYIKKPLQNFK